jgi:archaea-specific DNA-binding protein
MSEEKQQDSNSVLIGNKPFISYVKSVTIQFKAKNREEVIVKARGKQINRAIDIVEFVKKRALKDLNLETTKIKIDSNEFENKQGKKVNVSFVEITLSRKK